MFCILTSILNVEKQPVEVTRIEENIKFYKWAIQLFKMNAGIMR